MKILLVNPWAIRKFNIIIIPNNALGYLASALKRNGHNVTILDCAKDRINIRRFKEYIENSDFNLIGFSFFTGFFTSVKEYTAVIKNKNRSITTVVGGPHAILEPIETLELLKDVDFAFNGEAERGICQLAKELSQGRGIIKKEQLKKVENLIWRNSDSSVICNPRVFIENLDELDYPAWDLIRPQEYPTAPVGLFTKMSKVAPIIATRGCPFPCTFCAAGKMSGRKIRNRSVCNILGEIQWLQEEFGIEEIHILDDNFTLNGDIVKEFCESILEKDLHFSWSFPNGIRLDTLNGELLKLMERAGCYSFGVGIEFGTQKFLNLVKKDTFLEKIQGGIDLIKKTTKLRVTGFFILGHPQEEVRDVERTIDFACSLKLDRANFFNYSPFPGSRIYEQLKASGEIKDISYDDLYINNVVYHPRKISRKKMRSLQRKAFMKFFLRPRILWGIIKEIKTFSQLSVLVRKVIRLIVSADGI